MSAPRRILVTGASGFIGRHAVTALADQGHEVVALSRRGVAIPGAGQGIACDLLDCGAVRAVVADLRADVLLHLAWHDDPRDRWHSPANLDWVGASLALLRAFADAGGSRAVLGGSCAVYDWSAGPVLAEDSPLRPTSLYGAAKAALGTLALAAAPTIGLTLAEARIFFVYGPGEGPGRLVHDLIAGLLAGQPVPCTDGLQERDYLHAGDLGRALAAIVASTLTGPVNLASGQAIPVRDLVAEVARQIGQPDLPQLGALPRPASDPPRLVGATDRLATTGFVPRFSLSDGVADTIAAFRADAR